MKPQEKWQFSDALKRVDLARILVEAGLEFDAVRITVGKDVLTVGPFENVIRAGLLPRAVGFVSRESSIADLGGLAICDLEEISPENILDPSNNVTPRTHVLLLGDHVGKLCNRVECLVEVY